MGGFFTPETGVTPADEEENVLLRTTFLYAEKQVEYDLHVEGEHCAEIATEHSVGDEEKTSSPPKMPLFPALAAVSASLVGFAGC